MAKIVITYEYEPNLEHYPDTVKTVVDAMWCDVNQLDDGAMSIDEFLDGPGRYAIEVVE